MNQQPISIGEILGKKYTVYYITFLHNVNDKIIFRKFAETLKRLSDTDEVECQFIIITHDNEFIQELSGTAGVNW